MAPTLQFAPQPTTAGFRPPPRPNARNPPSTVEAADCSPPSPDVNRLFTIAGLLKLLAITFNFLCFLSVSVGGTGEFVGVGWATFVSISGFAFSIILLLVFLFNVARNLDEIPWATTDLIFCFLWTIFHFTSASILALSAAAAQTSAFPWAVASFFSFSAMITYAVDCFLRFLVWREGEDAWISQTTKDGPPTHL